MGEVPRRSWEWGWGRSCKDLLAGRGTGQKGRRVLRVVAGMFMNTHLQMSSKDLDIQ